MKTILQVKIMLQIYFLFINNENEAENVDDTYNTSL